MTYHIQPEDLDWFHENLGLYSGKIDETDCDFLPVKDFIGKRRLVTVGPRGTPEPGTDAGDEHRAAMDVLSILARVKSRLTRMETEGADDAETLVIPLDGPSLANKLVASSFTRFCRTLTNGQRERLMFEVTGVDLTKDSMSLLDDTAIILFMYCSSYIIRVLPKNTNLRLVATNNYAGVSINLRNKPWPVDVVRPHITAFVANAARNRLSTMVHGVATAPLLEAVEAAGARYVDGDALSQAAPSNGPGSG